MSYDIYFVKRHPDQTWDEALEARDESDDDNPLTPELLAAWDRIVPRATELLGDLELFETDEVRSLTHEATAIQASVSTDEVGITVPYWYSGAEAAQILETIYALARIIEEETNLPAYDPQLDRPLADLSPAPGTTILSTISTDLHGPN